MSETKSSMLQVFFWGRCGLLRLVRGMPKPGRQPRDCDKWWQLNCNLVALLYLWIIHFLGESSCPPLKCDEPGVCQGTFIDVVNVNSATECQVEKSGLEQVVPSPHLILFLDINVKCCACLPDSSWVANLTEHGGFLEIKVNKRGLGDNGTPCIV